MLFRSSWQCFMVQYCAAMIVLMEPHDPVSCLRMFENEYGKLAACYATVV